MRKWITSSKYPGIRWHEHSTRKHGPRADRCFGLRYSHNGKRYQPTLGWASAGWTEAKAALTLAELKENIRTGNGCISLTEKRELAEKKREGKAIKQEKDKKASITYSQFWERYYWPQQKHKAKGSVRTEEGLYRNWIAPIVGDMPLSEIRPKDIEKIKTALLKKKRATSTIKYTFGTISHLWNMARRDEYVHGDSPTTKISIPKHDNRRERFLTPEEAKMLLDELNSIADTPTTWRCSPCVAACASARLRPSHGTIWIWKERSSPSGTPKARSTAKPTCSAIPLKCSPAALTSTKAQTRI